MLRPLLLRDRGIGGIVIKQDLFSNYFSVKVLPMKLSPKFENVLRSGMTKFGHAVEKVIGSVEKARGSAKPSTSVEPILALESQLSMAKLKEMIAVSVDRVVGTSIPNLIDKSTLEINEGVMRFSPAMKEKGASLVVHVDIGGFAGTYSSEGSTTGVFGIRASIKNVPFEDGFFDFIVSDLATPHQGDISRSMKELGRLITPGGQALVVDFHPFGQFAKRGSARLRSTTSFVKGAEDYYKICGASGFSLNYIREAFFDETVRMHFETPEEKAAFRSIKDTPFLIFLFVSKKAR